MLEGHWQQLEVGDPNFGIPKKNGTNLPKANIGDRMEIY